MDSVNNIHASAISLAIAGYIESTFKQLVMQFDKRS